MAVTDSAALDRAVREQDKRVRETRVVLGREPLTYGERGEYSQIRDAWAARRMGDGEAQKRLDRHAAEMRVELRDRERRVSSAPEGVSFGFDSRAIDLTPGNGGDSVPPLWAIDQMATAARPTRVLASLIPSYPLTPGVVSVQVPRIVTGTTTADQTPPSAPVSDTDLSDAATGSQVVTIAGHSDVALQLIEQSGRNGAAFDQIVYRDLLSSYDAQLEAQLIAGTGTGVGSYMQIPGLSTITGTGSVSYVDASPTASEMWTSFGKAYATVSNTRKIVPQVWVMRGGRFAWLSTSEDTAGRPFDVPALGASYVADPTMPNPLGGLLGLPVFSGEAISVTQGAGANQDVVYCLRPSDMLLFEGPPVVATFSEVASGTLTGRVQLRRYVAAILGRYPSSVCTVGGTGFAVPSGF